MCIILMISTFFSELWSRDYSIPKLSQVWPVGALSNWLLCPFDISPSLFKHFFISGITKANHVLSLSYNQSFLQEILVPFSVGQYLETNTWMLSVPIPIELRKCVSCGCLTMRYIYIYIYFHVYTVSVPLCPILKKVHLRSNT